MAAPSLPLPQLILELFDIQGLKFGSFTMRTGEVTPVYIDMRVIWSYPKLVKAVTEHINKLMKEKNIRCDQICGLPYQGIPIASILSTDLNIPMLLKRQKPKEYGTCKAMEGHYQPGQSVLIVDDVLMTGGTFFEDIPFFSKEELKVTDAIVFCDRDQGGKQRIAAIHKIPIHSVVTLPQILDILVPAGKITQGQADDTLAYLKSNRFDTAEYGVSQ